MEKIGVREARNSFSQYIERVKKGEPFIITELGVPVAKLTPLEADLPEKLGKLLETRMASWNGGKPGGRKPVSIANHPSMTLTELVEEDRR